MTSTQKNEIHRLVAARNFESAYEKLKEYSPKGFQALIAGNRAANRRYDGRNEAYWADTTATSITEILVIIPTEEVTTYEDLGIKSFKLSDAAPEHQTTAEENSNAVTGLEKFLLTPRPSTISCLAELSSNLTAVAEWLEHYQESDFDEIAIEFRTVARQAALNYLPDQKKLLAEAQGLLDIVVELTLELRAPTGKDAIIELGRAKGSTKEQILAAAQALSKEKHKEVKAIFGDNDDAVLRIKTRKLLA
jgi:hypothetical protein